MKTLLKNKEAAAIRGEIKILTYKAGTVDRARPFIEKYKDARAKGDFKIADHYKRKYEKIFADNVIGKPNVTKNLIMQAANYGKDVIVQRLIGINTYSLNLSYCEIGTGNTTPAITDIALTTPVARASLSAGVAQDSGNNTAIIQYFFPDNVLTNSTYKEAGTFIDGTGTIGTGQLFNHAIFNTPYTKSAGTDITIQVTIALS